ncbi:alpha-L-rhamnosidase [Paenibacillus sp. Soil766]|uniref:glycoside hydrolase family 78 protein n=1 Tax=Paenibacillus sp. Soil766 TaxID=1736404 RepID=UPI00070A197B|nr:glycoside hydrolase family 78 protein [Paenibacillus sp. Soil766]KRF10001.1 alpha-L-rhamnosidase [Paenibacillus sp. Soil766]
MTIRVSNCKTEYTHNPIGLDVLKPRLFWQLHAAQSGVVQSAYQIRVATSPDKLEHNQADMWDSGKVSSNASTHVQYEGKPLQSEGAYYWQVRIWDGADERSEWSKTAYWMMGILSRGEWKAQWIGRRSEHGILMQPSPFFRKSFEVKKKVRRAIAYATALGVYELNLNGERIGDRFAPGWTDYNIRVQVQAVDMTDKIRVGDNVFGVILGDGWYAGTVGFLGDKVYGERPFFLMQVTIDYEDGTMERILTDHTWMTNRGPIQYSDMIKGEAYDAREELIGWHEPGYDDSSWEMPDVRAGYNGLLVAAIEPPIRITQTIKPISINKTAAGTYIYDMGQNMVGWTAVKVQGERGTALMLSHAEMLNPDGTLYVENLREARQQDHYILNGNGLESYEPHFTFHGFRYVELIGYPGEPNLDTIEGKVVHSDTPVTGKLETSDPMVNQLYSNITWGQRGNFLSVPTDCPQRDERLGWTGDAQIFARTAAYNMDVSRFFSKYVWDMVDCQQPSGAFTDVAPDAGWIRYKNWSTRLNWFAPDNSGWGDAGVIIPWTLYVMYGDKRILETHYEAMVKWVNYLKNTTDELVRPGYANYADWLSIGADTPNEVLATAYFAYSTKLIAQIAGVLGKTHDADQYQTLYEDIASAFRKAFVADDGQIHGDTQTVYVLALQFGLLTEDQRKQALERLVTDIQRRGDRLSTGFLGVGYLLPTLTDNGSLDVAYKLLTQEAFPSWMYSIKHGATTIWERWDGWTEEQGFQTPSMNSFNHYSLGSVGEWMFRYMAGIEADSELPGFQHVIIRPKPGGNLSWVKASYESLYGCIKVEWHLSDEGDYHLHVDIPANTTATIHIPGQTETTHRIGSGSYMFANASMLK